MSISAIIKTGGKQYKVKEKDVLKIEKISGEKDAEIEFKDVLMVFDDKGKEVKVGTPFLSGASVQGKILAQSRAKKVTIIKYKPKTRYRVKRGHRQPYTKVEIKSIKM